MAAPDTTVVDLHRMRAERVVVREVEGEAYRIRESKGGAEPLTEGATLEAGDTVALGPNARVVTDEHVLRGGPKGHAHALVGDRSLRSSPGRSDVPKLLVQFAQIENEMSTHADDPFQTDAPKTPLERASAAEFARTNLVVGAARELSRTQAEELQAVPLFVSDETAFVAVSRMTVRRLRRLVEALERPVHPHIVDEDVLEELMERAYSGYDAVS